jgi:hypothetical protein
MLSLTWSTVLRSSLSCLMVGRVSKTTSGSSGEDEVGTEVASLLPLGVALAVCEDVSGAEIVAASSGAKMSSVKGHTRFACGS